MQKNNKIKGNPELQIWFGKWARHDKDRFSWLAFPLVTCVDVGYSFTSWTRSYIFVFLSLAMSDWAHCFCRGWMHCNPTCWDKCLIVQPYLLFCLWLWFALVVLWGRWDCVFLEWMVPVHIWAASLCQTVVVFVKPSPPRGDSAVATGAWELPKCLYLPRYCNLLTCASEHPRVLPSSVSCNPVTVGSIRHLCHYNNPFMSPWSWVYTFPEC